MNIPDIDFTRVRSLGAGGPHDRYEQLVCELVIQELAHVEAKPVSLHGAVDGECYWALPGGAEHSCQGEVHAREALAACRPINLRGCVHQLHFGIHDEATHRQPRGQVPVLDETDWPS